MTYLTKLYKSNFKCRKFQAYHNLSWVQVLWLNRFGNHLVNCFCLILFPKSLFQFSLPKFDLLLWLRLNLSLGEFVEELQNWKFFKNAVKLTLTTFLTIPLISFSHSSMRPFSHWADFGSDNLLNSSTFFLVANLVSIKERKYTKKYHTLS